MVRRTVSQKFIMVQSFQSYQIDILSGFVRSFDASFLVLLMSRERERAFAVCIKLCVCVCVLASVCVYRQWWCYSFLIVIDSGEQYKLRTGFSLERKSSLYNKLLFFLSSHCLAIYNIYNMWELQQSNSLPNSIKHSAPVTSNKFYANTAFVDLTQNRQNTQCLCCAIFV